MILRNFTLAFTAIFVALDIIGTLPLYISMTHRMPPRERRRIVNTSIEVALLVALVFVFLGQGMFMYLGISVSDFKIAGGLVLLLISLADLVGGPEAVHQKASSGNTGVVPLAVPLITGPGLLTTLILQVQNFGRIVTLTALVCNFVLGWLFLNQSERITKYMGKDGTVVISKIAALLLAAIAVSMMRAGVLEVVATMR